MKEKKFLFGILLILALAFSFLLDDYTFRFVDLIQNNFFDIFLGLITYLGEFIIILILLTLLFLFKRSKRIYTPLMWICFIILGIVSIGLKFLIARPRPFGLIDYYPFTQLISYSFPSLHAAVALFALIILYREFPKHKYTWIIIGMLVILSRVYLKVHYLSDVVGGSILGYIFDRLYLHDKLKSSRIIKKILKK